MAPSHHMSHSFKLEEESSKLHVVHKAELRSSPRRSSSISFECHSDVIFGDMMFDDSAAMLEHEEDDNGNLSQQEDEENVVAADSSSPDEDELNASLSFLKGTEISTSLHDETPPILKDEHNTPPCLTNKYEARIVSKALRRGNSMLLRRCASDVMSPDSMRRTPSYLDRVIRSVSAELRSLGMLGGEHQDGTPSLAESRNATFSPMGGARRSAAAGQQEELQQPNASASKAGRSILLELMNQPRKREEQTSSSAGRSSKRAAPSEAPQFFMDSLESLGSTDFVKLMEGDESNNASQQLHASGSSSSDAE